jgi:hypothetical protein
VAGHDLVAPADDRATEGANLDGAGLVLEVDAQLVDELGGKLGIGDDGRTPFQAFQTRLKAGPALATAVTLLMLDRTCGSSARTAQS